MVKRHRRTLARHLRREWALAPPVVTTLLFLIFGKRWLADLSNGLWFGVVSLWLVGAILVSALAVVRHAEGVAERVREPLGTVVLTLAMSGMEMLMIAAVMYSGKGAPALARDTMMAIVMIVLNGLVGTCLLVGGLRYREQTTNLYGPNAFLGVLLPLSVLGLVLPRFTRSSAGPTLSPLQSLFLISMSVGLYAVFLAIQTRRHREYFIEPEAGAANGKPARARPRPRPRHLRAAFSGRPRPAAGRLCRAGRPAGQADRQADRPRHQRARGAGGARGACWSRR